MRIKITDDKKERYQSFEAEGEISIDTDMGHLSFNAIGYGGSKDEAIENLRKIIRNPLFDTKTFSYS